MEILTVLIVLSFSLASLGLVGFFWAEKKGQFKDLDAPAQQILIDDDE